MGLFPQPCGEHENPPQQGCCGVRVLMQAQQLTQGGGQQRYPGALWDALAFTVTWQVPPLTSTHLCATLHTSGHLSVSAVLTLPVPKGSMLLFSGFLELPRGLTAWVAGIQLQSSALSLSPPPREAPGCSKTGRRTPPGRGAAVPLRPPVLPCIAVVCSLVFWLVRL